MAVNPTLIALIDYTLVELPSLARQVIDATTNALQRNPKHFPLLDPWGRRRARFALEFETELRPQLTKLRQGVSPGRTSGATLEGLSLVDEHQALRDVGIAHVVELCSEASRTELFQLGNFFTALNRGAVHGRDMNALRPALFARALVNALAGPDLTAEGHYALVRAAAPGLAGALVPIYQALVGFLHEAELTPLVSVRPGQERPRRRDARESQAGALADWHTRSQGIASQPVPLAPAFPVQDALFDRLYERMLADPKLAAPVKAQLASLQAAVARVCRDDPSLLRREDHPTWRLINAVAAYASGFSNAQDPRLGSFLRYLEEQTRTVIESARPNGQQFEHLLKQVDDFIARQARERSAPSTAALAALEREQQRGAWLHLLRDQLDAQARAARSPDPVRRFLRGEWADAVVQAMVQHGQSSSVADQLVQLVDELIDSLQPHPDASHREQLRRTLPGLVTRIESALQAAALSETRRKSLLLELMQLHSAVLTGQAKTAPASAPRTHTSTDEPRDSEVSRLLDERESQYASVWTHAKVDRAALPTQPLPLPDTAGAEQRRETQVWLDQLQLGGWFHLFVEGGWDTAQLVWISADRRYFLFIDQSGTERYSLTDGALTQLYLNGLVMYLEQEGLVERAVATLMQDLERG